MIYKLVVALLVLCAAGARAASPATAGPASLMLNFDNRGSKVMSDSVSSKIMAALAKTVFQVPANQVFQVSGVGRSNLVNHKSTVTYAATGPTLNGKTPYENCLAAAKGGWFSSSTVKKALKAATDSWMPGDSVKVESATCAQFKSAANNRSGRKMM